MEKKERQTDRQREDRGKGRAEAGRGDVQRKMHNEQLGSAGVGEGTQGRLTESWGADREERRQTEKRNRERGER